jgi:hypothetical protein
MDLDHLNRMLLRVGSARAIFDVAIAEERAAGRALHDALIAERRRFLQVLAGETTDEAGTSLPVARAIVRARAATSEFNRCRDEHQAAWAAFDAALAEIA